MRKVFEYAPPQEDLSATPEPAAEPALAADAAESTAIADAEEETEPGE